MPSSRAMLLSRTALGLALLTGAALAAAPAQAQNLVTNGDFETGDFTGFDVSGLFASVDSGVGIGGSDAASFGAISPDIDILSQTLATTAGQKYTLTFFAQTPELGTFGIGQPNTLLATFGGSPVAAFSVPDASGFTQYSYTVTANSASSVLAFYVSNDNNYTQLDNISVTPAAVPEASTTASFGLLLALGMGGVVLAAKRKKAGQAAA